MRIIIVGGGNASVYTANKIKELSPQNEVIIVSDETYMPYDRIHLCRLLNKSTPLSDIALELNPEVAVELNCKINAIDKVIINVDFMTPRNIIIPPINQKHF